MKTEGLPEQVCVLDIEVWRPGHWQSYLYKGVDIGWHHSKLAFVGTKVFKLKEGKYQPEKCKRYRNRQLSELGQFLSNFSGLILGHNIFAWDYRMLDRLPLSKIIPKSFDVGFYLKDWSGVSSGLDELAQINFAVGKREGVSPAKDWQHLGKRKKVYQYNETDCDLTFALWEQMTFMGEISARIKNPPFEQLASLIIPDTDMPILLGHKPQMSFRQWQKLLDRIREEESQKRIAL